MSTRRTRLLAATIGATIAVTVAGTTAALAGGDGSSGQNAFREQLTGYQEDPVTISTAGGGQLRLKINEQAQEITYTLSYTANLRGSVTQGHLHFGGRAQSGGISVFLCSNLGNGPAGTQTCPAAPATVSGTITPADIIGPAEQGLAAGEFDELVDAIRARTIYVNVHTTAHPAGEIRAQLGG